MRPNQIAFLEKLAEMFPDTQTSGVADRKQINEVVEALGCQNPMWLMKNKAGRGLYVVPGIQSNVVLKEEVVREEVHFGPARVIDSAEIPVPQKDTNYVFWGNAPDLDLVIKSRIFHPTYITGPTGNGKSTMVEQLCAKHSVPLVRVNLNSIDDQDSLIGTRGLVDGNTVIEDGPVVKAMKQGCMLLLDEIDAADPNSIMCLQGVLEGKPLYYKLRNEYVYPAQGFNVVATANTKGKGSDDGRYIGTKPLNEAFLERFAITMEQEYPPAKIELKIISNLMKAYNCYDEGFRNRLSTWAEAIRKTFDDGGVDETITTRRLIHIVKNFSIFKSERKAIEMAVNRFDTATKEAFIDLFDKMSSDTSAQPAVSETVNEVTTEVI